MKFLHFFPFMLLVAAGFAVRADMPLLFSRDALTIISAPKEPEAKPEKTSVPPKKEKTADAEPKERGGKDFEIRPASPPAPVEHRFQVEVRPMEGFRLDGYQNFRDFAPDEGLLLVAPETSVATMDWASLPVAVDVVFISARGKIVRIMPQFDATLAGDMPDAPEGVAALLLLQAERTQRLGIAPGDTVAHPLFHPSPVILE